MSFYLDANVVVALLTPEPSSPRADRFLAEHPDVYIVSNLASAEYASAISRRVRLSEMSTAEGRIALASLDDWIPRSARWIEIKAQDISRADAFLRRLDLPLLTPDAIHIAVAQRLDTTLLTFDRQMAANAGKLGAAVAIP